MADLNFGINAGLVEELYAQYLENPESVDASWRSFFDERTGARRQIPGAWMYGPQAIAASRAANGPAANGQASNGPVTANGGAYATNGAAAAHAAAAEAAGVAVERA